MSDWSEATDPVPPRRELTDKQRAKRARYWERERKRQWRATRPDVPSTYRVEPDFDEMGA